jgi:hypothetical protein
MSDDIGYWARKRHAKARRKEWQSRRGRAGAKAAFEKRVRGHGRDMTPQHSNSKEE